MTHSEQITRFIIDEFLPGTPPHELAADYDLLNSGAIDSVGMLKMIAWIEDQFDIPVADTDLDPHNFRSVSAIDNFVRGAEQPAGR